MLNPYEPSAKGNVDSKGMLFLSALALFTPELLLENQKMHLEKS